MKADSPFRPQLLDMLSGYTGSALVRDIRAGLVVAGFALPLCLAFGAATGLGPTAGILTSVAAGLAAALLGGSRVQITGPSAYFIVAMGGIMAVHGATGVFVATFLAGLLLVAFGFLKLGPVLRLLPHPVLVGFTGGIAVTLVISQGQVLLTNPWTVGLGLCTAAVVVVGEFFWSKGPWTLLALVAGTAVSWAAGSPAPTLASAFAPVGPVIQPFRWELLTYSGVIGLLPAAFTLAFLGAIESLLSASVADALVSDRHRPHAELVGQGVGNTLSALLGGLPATGAMGRTNANIRSGGRSPMAAVVHSLVLLAALVLLGAFMAPVPLAVLSGIVMAVGIRMVDFREARLIFKTTQADALALVTTFGVTIAFDLAFAVISGLLVAFFFFVRGMAQSSHTFSSDRTLAADLPRGTHVLDLNGAFFFGAAAKFDEAIRPLLARARTIILRMDDVTLLDATGTRVLHRLLHDAANARVRVVMSEVQPPVLRVMEQAELIEALGTPNLFASFEGALRDVRSKQPLVFSAKIEEGCHDPL